MTAFSPLNYHNANSFEKPVDRGMSRLVAMLPGGGQSGRSQDDDTRTDAPSNGSRAETLKLRAVVARFSTLAKLSEEELCLLHGLSRGMRLHLPRTQIGTEANSTMPRIMVSGWACRQRLLADGRRQIIGFVLPGDPLGSLDTPEPPSECSFLALTPVTTVDASAIARAATSGNPAHRGLARAARLLARHEMALMRDQIVRVGRQTAYERVVHLMLELHARLQAAGMASDSAFSMPLTQEVLSDCLGLSIVHVNRTLKQVRRDGLFQIRSGQVKIIDRKLMQAVADWLPTNEQGSASAPLSSLYSASTTGASLHPE